MIVFAIVIAAWFVLSAAVCWIAGRFIRVGMVELQPVASADLVEDAV